MTFLHKLFKQYKYIKPNIYILNHILSISLYIKNSQDQIIQSKVSKINIYKPVLKITKILSLAGLLYKKLNNKANNTNILILGLGGGDLVRTYYKLFNLNKNKSNIIDTVEYSNNIIYVAKKYFYLNKIINKLNNINIIHKNAYEYILDKNIDKKYNIIIVDIFTILNSSPEILQEQYISNLYNKLDNNGIIVFNLLLSDFYLLNNISLFNKYFDNNLLITNNRKFYNTIIFGFKNNKYKSYIINPMNSKNILAKYLYNINNNNKKYITANYK